MAMKFDDPLGTTCSARTNGQCGRKGYSWIPAFSHLNLAYEKMCKYYMVVCPKSMRNIRENVGASRTRNSGAVAECAPEPGARLRMLR